MSAEGFEDHESMITNLPEYRAPVTGNVNAAVTDISAFERMIIQNRIQRIL